MQRLSFPNETVSPNKKTWGLGIEYSYHSKKVLKKSLRRRPSNMKFFYVCGAYHLYGRGSHWRARPSPSDLVRAFPKCTDMSKKAKARLRVPASGHVGEFTQPNLHQHVCTYPLTSFRFALSQSHNQRPFSLPPPAT